MKKNIFYFLLVLALPLVVSCSKDELSSTSVIIDSEREENKFDVWLNKNYMIPYNIDFKYRMEDIESDLYYNLIPAEYKKSIQMAKLVQYLCIEAYDSLTGSKDYIRQNFPKILNFIGSGAHNNNGTMILGTAEGGYKITLFYINHINTASIAAVNYYTIKTIHHEFSHILHQKKPYATNFKEISGSNYVADSWNTEYETEDTSLPDGFITPYAAKADDEDFVELIATYVTITPAAWSAKLVKAGTTGRPLIEAKFEIVFNYMLNTWGINLTSLRAIVLERQSNVFSKIDLNDID